MIEFVMCASLKPAVNCKKRVYPYCWAGINVDHVAMQLETAAVPYG